MAAGGQVAEFFGTLGFRIDKASIKQFDKTLDLLEKRATKFAEESLSHVKVNISRFGFSEDFNTRMHKALKARMKVASGKGVTPEIRLAKFEVDKTALLAEMKEAILFVENNLKINLRTGVERPVTGVAGARGGVSRFGAGMGVGAAAGGLGRGFIPGLGVAFGISQLNRINQELIGQQFSSQAIFGGVEEGQQGMKWLRQFSDEAGIDYRKQGQPYLRMIASATNAGMGLGETQDIFAGVTRYGRTMGLGEEDMKGSLRAIEQMLNKQQIYSEELKTQLAERMPGVISAMAEAVTGNAANTKELFELMEKGEVSAVEHLGQFAEILQKRAFAGGAYERAIKSSAAEQGRFNNAFNDMVKVFSEAGFEEGQANIFRTMTDFFLEMKPLVKGLGQAWEYVGDVLRIPLGLLVDLGRGLEVFSEYTGMSIGNVTALATALGLLLFPFTRTITLITGVLAVLEDITGFFTGRNSVTGLLVDAFKKEYPEEYSKTITTLKETFSSLYEVVKLIISGYKELFSLISDTSAIEGTLQLLRTIANEIKAATDALLLLTGRKKVDEYGTYAGKDAGVIEYGVKGVARLLKDGVDTFTPEQRKVASTRDAIATLIHRMRSVDMAQSMGQVDKMTPQQLQDFQAEKNWLQMQENVFENTYNIDISGASDPVAVAREVERQLRDREQEALQAVQSKSTGGAN